MANQIGWPELEWAQWQATADTLHMWTQIVGKTRMGLTPLKNHWWNVPLYVSARGLTTSAMPLPDDAGVLEIEFDFLIHALELRRSDGMQVRLPLRAQTVATFYAGYLAALKTLGVEVAIWPVPVEVAAPIRFDQDTTHASYDRAAVERFHRILMSVARVLERFSTGFQGKISPVHFFWGSFDLCVTRFSGRKASGPAKADRVQAEAYSDEVISAGFWPGNGGYGKAAFYCYAAPVPQGLSAKPARPGVWDTALGEFLLGYDEVRAAVDPEATLLEFLQATYAAGADAAGWDRAALERPMAAAPAASDAG